MEIPVQQAKELLENNADIRLIDCREDHEYSVCHIPGAQLIPLSCFRTEAPAKLKDKKAHIIIYCHHGMRSLKATEYLLQLGYSNVVSMAGGIDQWSQQVDASIRRY